MRQRKATHARQNADEFFRRAAVLGFSFSLAASLVASAGDILRGGAVAGSRPTNAPPSAVADAAVERARANAQDALARTTQAVRSVQAMQDAARAAAIRGPGNAGTNPATKAPLLIVPNGLAPGGLQVAPGVPKNLGNPTPAEDASLWRGARLPVQTKVGGNTVVNVEQTQSQALLTWETFNIGKETTLNFNQSRGGSDQRNWIAFNKINDPSGAPSQILGRITAPGQVYVINRNGIIFGGASQVNVNTLVASTLPINDNLIGRGLLNNPDLQFLFSALPISAGSGGTPAFNPTIVDGGFKVSAMAATYTLAEQVALDPSNTPVRAPAFTFRDSTGVKTALIAGTDYTLAVDAATRKATATFTAAGLAKVGAAPVTVTYTPVVVKSGDLVVQPGARLVAPQNADGNGGRIMLAGANVTNAGTIATPGGQTILAAGLQVGVQAHSSADPSLRGLDVVVGRVSVPPVAGIPTPVAGGGTVTNSGLIDIQRGSASLTGRTVEQLGAISSSTSVSLNGRVDLNASYDAIVSPPTSTLAAEFLNKSTGAVELGAGSMIQILPETWTTDTAAGLELALRSQVNITGRTIHLGHDSTLLAPNATVSLRAGRWVAVPPRSTFVANGGQVYFDSGAMINVAGSTGASAPITENIFAVQFRGAELAPSPLQRGGLLRGPELTLDLRKSGEYDGRYWIGTPLGDATGFLGLIKRTVGELTAAGGSVDISAGGSVVLQHGASVDVSGGTVRYDGGLVRTTRVLSQGQLLDIADATPDRIYDGIYTGTSTFSSAKWGITETFASPLAPTGEHFEQSYTRGLDAGAITISAPAMVLDGELRGLTVAGPRQLRESQTQSDMPRAGALTLQFRSKDISTANFLDTFPAGLQVVFNSLTAQVPAAAFALDPAGEPEELDARRRNLVVLSPELLKSSGFGSLTVNNEEGSIRVPAGVNVTTKTRGTLSLTAANIDIAGNVNAPGGTLAFQALNLSPFQRQLIQSNPNATAPKPAPGLGSFTLHSGATLNAAGVISDERAPLGESGTRPLAPAGGSVSIGAFAANLESGSTIDVSGGVIVTADGQRHYGNGGSIEIKTSQDANLPSLIGGGLKLGATLRGFSGAKGGSLAIQAPLVQVGGLTPLRAETLLLQPEFFSTGGFTSFHLTAIGVAPGTPGRDVPEVYVTPGTQLAPVADSFLAIPNPAGEAQLALEVIRQDVGLRAPVSLEFSAPGVTSFTGTGLDVRGDVVLGAGATIRTDPGASVALNGNTVAVLGSIIAPGGTISIKGGSNSKTIFNELTRALVTTYLGPQSVLSTAGTAVYEPDAFGRRLGEVLPGGTITVQGNIAAAFGAVLDVSGGSGTFDIAAPLAAPLDRVSIPLNSGLNAPLAKLQTVPTRIDSDAGAIVLAGGQMLLTDATLLGRAGGPTALGGELYVSSGRFYADGVTPNPYDVNLAVQQSGRTIPVPFAKDQRAIGQAPRDQGGKLIPGYGYFAADAFAQGGFDSLTLAGVVDFRGPVSIRAARELSVASDGVLLANSTVRLSAPHVTLGRAFPTPALPNEVTPPFGGTAGAPIVAPPLFGSGRLFVEADLIDVGTLSLRNIARAEFSAVGGDIRGDGILSIQGDLTLRAAQIYPVTASDFRIAAYDHPSGGVTTPGSVTILGAGSAAFPLSAGGTLSIYASKITQSGVLRAPLGSITLGWDGTGPAPTDLATGTALPFPITKQITLTAGSITSVSAIDPATGAGVLIPYGVSPDGNSWIDSHGADITSGGLKEKSIGLSGKNIATQDGSTIDLRGGGDLYAYRFVNGNGGTVDLLGRGGSAWTVTREYQPGDLVSFGGATWSARVRNTGETPTVSTFWTRVPQAYAVIPSYRGNAAPYSTFNNSSSAANLIGSYGAGYLDASLKVGDRIYLNASESLAAGTYTLLPARYANLPGAVLVTPLTGTPFGTIETAEGGSLVAGYRFNDLNRARSVPTLASWFDVASPSTLADRVSYESYFANFFLAQSAAALGIEPQRRPTDSGYLLLQATQGLSLFGQVASPSINNGRGSRIDITTSADPATPVDLVINGSGRGASAGVITLSAAVLNSFDAESLLIGGRRSLGSSGTTVTAQSGKVTVAALSDALAAPDLILASKTGVTLDPGAKVASTELPNFRSERLLLSGDGALLRVSTDPSASVVRTVTPTTPPTLSIGAGASVSGASLILDSTGNTILDPAAILHADRYALSSGRISIQLENPGMLLADPGLVLAGQPLQDLQANRSLSLLSYSALDFYGTGDFGGRLGTLSLNAGEIRGINQGAGTVKITAGNLTLGNSAAVTPVIAPAAASGTLEFDAQTIRLGANNLAIDRYDSVILNAAGKIIGTGRGGLSIQADLAANTPLLTGTAGSVRTLTAGGAIQLSVPTNAKPATSGGGLGASLAISGTSVTADSAILLPSGSLSITATTGDLLVNGRLDVSGTSREFYDVTRFTDAGDIRLTATAGGVTLGADSVVDVSANAGGGNAGTLTVASPNGVFTAGGKLQGKGGAGGKNGSFELTTLALPSTSALSQTLADAKLTEAQNIRVRTGAVNIDGPAAVHTFQLSADDGDITVAGTIDASGQTGGSIVLTARGGVTLLSGSVLTVAAKDFNSAGKGGSVDLESGAQQNGVAGTGFVDIQTGSKIDLSVASRVNGDAVTLGSSAYEGKFSGTLHIRAPQNNTFTNLLVKTINGEINGASSILVEGYRIYDLTASGGAITSAVQTQISANGWAFLGTPGTTTPQYTMIRDGLLGANNTALEPVLVIAPGAELLNRNGNLTLGTANSTATSDWNLAALNGTNQELFRFGEKRAPGVLTLRASGDVVFFNALSDGFISAAYNARLLNQVANTPLPLNTQSWTYRLTAGADLGAADFTQVVSGAGAGYLKLGKNNDINASNSNTNGVGNAPGPGALTSNAVTNRFQVIRTGSGDITISTARSVQLLNQFATIYTAGTRVVNNTLNGNFNVPITNQTGGDSSLGANQQPTSYPALYSMAGGNVVIHAGENIEHLTSINGGPLVADSQHELPNNWLYRRGYIDPVTGEFGIGRFNDVTTTSWWIDFSNFFQGIGALGGGNVTMTAVGSVNNVDAVIPTNARLGISAGSKLLELGGGDLVVRAGADIDGGVYYVERGHGTLAAGRDITTNETRSLSLGRLTIPNDVQEPENWLPTTLFLGKGGFDITARGDLLLGPVGNPFLLPVGINNSIHNRSYFSTYSPESFVNVSAIGGTLTLREAATAGDSGSVTPLLQAWAQQFQLLTTSPRSASFYQPWLRLAETSVTPFASVVAIQPATLRATSFSGDLNLVGNITLSPAPRGTLELFAGGAVNALQPAGVENLGTIWTASQVNVSDADPASIPGVSTPFGYQQFGSATSTLAQFLEPIDVHFRESGSTSGAFGVVQTKQALHGASVLHAGDPTPLRIYANDGDISGLTLFSPKAAQVFAGQDIQDVALYIQNTKADDTSIVAARRDIIPFRASTPLRNEANADGNLPTAGPLAGDIQISGPGTLEVLAGRNLDLGTGSNNADGTGVGITSIGNGRNPALPFAGASIIAGAGIGASTGLSNSSLNVADFIREFIDGPDGGKYLDELRSELKGRDFKQLDSEEQSRIALEVFYRVLRDTGRDFPTAGNYDKGFAAIESLFGPGKYQGDIFTRGRDIRTRNGGDISLLAPGGKLTLADSTIGNPLTPPGIVTESGGNISIFTDGSVEIGIGRIFTLRGGNQIIWSSNGDIAAGSSPKTVQSAPPTRVLIDPQSASVQTDLAGLATGGGIGVLATVANVSPGNVDLIAPKGAVDAGDAGIRVTGNLNIAAVQVLNADNISVAGTSTGTPVAPVVAAPNISGLASASNTAAAASNAGEEAARQARASASPPADELPPVITVDVVDVIYDQQPE